MQTFECIETTAGRGQNQIKVWKFDCPHCGVMHTHSAEAGHRVAHCYKPNSPYDNEGYVLVLKRHHNGVDATDPTIGGAVL